MQKLIRMFTLFMVTVIILTACTQTQQVDEPQDIVGEEVAEVVVEVPEVEEEVVAEEPEEEFIFGILMVGPFNDRGWSEAHYIGGQYVEANLPGTKMIYIDKVNPADRPGTTPDQLAEELVAQGAKLIIFNSDDMKDGSYDFAVKYPEIPVLHISGDFAWEDGMNYKGLPNYANYMPEMEYGEMIGGCAAALESNTGKLGFVGPLINDETRRYVNAYYLGAEYCWTEYLDKPIEELELKVTWIGFWFHIPGFTTDPTLVADEFLNSGYDVIGSGLDTTEPLVQTEKAAAAGADVKAVAYDYEFACEEAPDICLGVRYFNWGPEYLRVVKMVQEGTFEPYWGFGQPDWTNINNPDTSAVGYLKGDGLSEENAVLLDQFIAELGAGLNLWVGPLNWQDGSVFLADGEEASLVQMWYSGQLLEGIEGQSISE